MPRGCRQKGMRKHIGLALVALGMAGCATFQASDTRATEKMLVAAGFQPKPADTPEKLAHLRSLTARTMITRQENGTPYYLFADPESCRCLYVGTAQQYQDYQTLRRRQNVADEELLTSADRDDAIGGVWGLWP